MAGQARVESIDALRDVRVALCKFAETVGTTLAEIDAELARCDQWLKLDRQNHWKREMNKRSELVARAKSALARKQSMRSDLGSRFSCIEEQKALDRAVRQLAESQQKLANVRHWQRRFTQEVFAYQGQARQLTTAVESDIPKALAALDGMLAALEAYTATPDEQRSTAEPAPESMARPLDQPPPETADDPPADQPDQGGDA